MNNRNLCVLGWCIMNGWKKTRVYKFIGNICAGGVRPYTKIRREEQFDQAVRASKAQHVVAWLDRYAHEMGDFLPCTDGGGRANVIHLPFPRKKYVFLEYQRQCPSQFQCAHSYFMKVWRKHRNYIKKSRLVAGSGMASCGKCEHHKRELNKARSEAEKDKIYFRYRGHILL